ncbi:MAG: IPT/TIG domain-containing protein, partial [Candidatus Magasanikbacteria bacterium]|nr:IPT/TIG domain-containing protein [Candidatus Magasanikbacteria bacterium]
MKNKKSLTIGFLTIISLVVGFFVMAPVLAQQVNTGIDFGQYTGLVNTDIRIIIAKIIRAALALLGIVVLAYTLYGGYLYLTAGGNADQVKSAKTVLKNAVIGLVIILSAFSITQFIITKLTGAIIGNYCLENPTDHGCFCAANPLDISCGGCTGSCVPPGQVFYSTVAPQGSLPIYNVVLNAQFLSAFGEASFDAATITNDNVQIFKQLGAGSFDTTPYPVTFETVSPSVVAIHPVGYCGEGIVANDCFASSTTYKVVLRNGANGIKSIGGAELDCSNHVCETLFTTGDRYDATAPVVNMVLPGNWAVVGDTIDTTVKASYSDDSGVKGVSFYFKNNQNAITGIRYFTLNPFQPEGEISFPNWTPHLQNAEKAEFGELSASAFDLDNHRATSTVQQIKIVPAYCFNGSLDTDKLEQQVHSLAPEIGPDCGLRSECGACTGDFCDTNFDCAGTYCDLTQHKCVARPKILEVSPLSAGPGSLVTVLGSNFGTTAGGVLFNGTVARVVACPLTGNTPSWYDNGVIVRVPEGSNVSGTLALQTSEYTGVTTDITHFDTTATGDNWGNPAFFNVTTGVLPGLSCVYPRNGEPTTPIEIAGENLGGTKGALRFADLLVDGTDITSWAAQNVHLNVPKIPAQTLSLKAVTSGGLISNALPFTVNPVAEDVLPKIDFVDPSQGPVGTYVTIAGRNFGSTGSVVFKTGPAAATGVAADLPPDLCGNFWTPTQIIIKVPAGINLGEASSLDFYIQVTNNLNDKSNSLKFTVNKEEIKPGLCKITPDNGPATTDVTLLGERFGATTRGAVEYWQSVSSSFNPLTGTQSWTDLQITDKVPAAAKTGGVKIWSAEKSLYSNSLSFKVQNCKEEISKGKTL